jgi:peptide/nickel transport system permease protein
MKAKLTDAAGDSAAVEERMRQVRKTKGYWTIVFRQLRRNKGALLGAGFLLFLVFVAIFAPLIAPYDPIEMAPTDRLQPPSLAHPMGTDNFGRDALSRIIFGTRISLTVGFISVGIGAAAGMILGLAAGYFGGYVDTVIMRVIDALLAFPGILLSLAIVAALGSNLQNVMIAVGISSVPRFTRVIRGSVLSAKENLYVLAARSIGCRSLSIMYRHILPNVFGPVVILATLGIGSAILLGAGLSYLGLGAQPPTPEWGLMLSTGRPYIAVAWWVMTFPGLAIMVTVLAVNMFGDGLRDALDPRLRQ